MKLLKKLSTLTLLIITLNSCIGDVDFNQANDLEFSPEFDIALVYFNLQKNDFIDQNTNLETPLRLDFTNIDIFDNSTVSDKLEKVVLKFEIENTFNKSFSIDFILMDNNNNVLISIPFTINQNENQSLEITYLKGNQDFEKLIQTSRITVIGNMQQDNNITTEDMFIHFKSVADLYLKIKDV